MSYLIGEYECKLDAKGRLMIPAGLRKQVPGIETDGLVVNRGFEKHLVIYTRAEWDKIMSELYALNQYEKKTRDFVRYFTRGATELTLDSAGRVLFPKTLLEYGNIGTEVVLSSALGKIEMWAKEAYEAQMDEEPEEFAALAEMVMGGNKNG